jgi:ribonuclease P protein component
MKSFSFPKKERLLNRGDFVNLNRSGKRHHTRHFVVVFKENEIDTTRLGITVSKKIANAAKRNKAKRLIREYFRLNKATLPKGYDIVIAAKQDASHLDLWKIEKELGEVISEKKFHI